MVDFVTNHLLKFLNQFPINPVNFALELTRQSILKSLGEQGVTVDPAKLTDINLLRRHVLKRCIYGVDLNPMAVELAKVSLWLDCFTLGAPLNFLDHHMRCGNSLIGATFKDLEEATATLFALNYEPLLRAIHHVLFVSKMADATAAEVATLVSHYDQARQSLAGYQIVLDLLVAEHFRLPQAKHLVKMGSDLDLTDQKRFYASLHDDQERNIIAQVEARAQRPDLRFFHWELEFPEVFFGVIDANQRQIKHKDQIKEGSAGFDVIVGNPPYVRQEIIKPLKPYLKKTYQTFDSTNDLYVYFQEKEIHNLRVHGHMGMIVANKWMRSGYGEGLRDFLQRTGQPLEVIDFGHSPIFPDADTFPCILLMTKRPQPLTEKEKPAEAETMAACEVPREDWHDRIDLGSFVSKRRHHIPTRLLRTEGWSLENRSVLTLLEKIRITGIPLKHYAGCRPQRGLLTGLNEAFIIDGSTRDRLVRASKKSEEIIRPLLRGRDADRWRSHDSGCFLITIASSENADWPWSDCGTKAEDVFRSTFPAIYDHFLPLKKALIERQDQGRYYWELRSCDYMGEFQKPKIIWQEMAWFTRFSVDRSGYVLSNTAYILTSVDPLIVAVLNSPLAWWFMWRTAQHGKDEVLRLIHSYIADFPIPNVSQARTKELIASTVETLAQVMATLQAFEREVESLGVKLFSIPEFDSRVVTWLTLSEDAFLTRFLKLPNVGQRTPKLLEEISAFHQRHRSRKVSLLTRQLDLEKNLASLVEDAYDLTPEERALLRSTRPVRDPLDVLEGRIRGRTEENDVNAIEE